MKVLVIGSGGREHALVWKLAQSPHVKKIYWAPGNAGTTSKAVTVDLSSTDFEGLTQFVAEHDIGFTVVGPEAPLSAGVVDHFRRAGLRIFGPTAYAARLESSKIFAKEVMARTGVPTAPYQAFSLAADALAWLAAQPEDKPWVVKADGLAAGKGVLMCANRAEAEYAVQRILVQREFGAAGDRLLIEERLTGYEVSLIAICSGQVIIPLAPAQDYKRIGEGDTGPNTGGMGVYSPVPNFPQDLLDYGVQHIIAPVLREIEFTGAFYAGLMITEQGPQVIEFNVRFGDPETQVVLPRLETDLYELLLAAADGQLDGMTAEWTPRKAVSVVLASNGYPEKYECGKVIYGLKEAAALPDVAIFHAGTRREGKDVVTNGGRVLNVTALGDTYAQAIDRVYEAVSAISWAGMVFRRDIGARVRNSE